MALDRTNFGGRFEPPAPGDFSGNKPLIGQFTPGQSLMRLSYRGYSGARGQNGGLPAVPAPVNNQGEDSAMTRLRHRDAINGL